MGGMGDGGFFFPALFGLASLSTLFGFGDEVFLSHFIWFGLSFHLFSWLFFLHCLVWVMGCFFPTFSGTKGKKQRLTTLNLFFISIGRPPLHNPPFRINMDPLLDIVD